MITPETGQLIAFGDNDYLPEVEPSTRTALVSARKGVCVHSGSRLRECQTQEPSSSKPIAQKRPAKTEQRRTDAVLRSNPTKMAPKVVAAVWVSRMGEPAMLVQSKLGLCTAESAPDINEEISEFQLFDSWVHSSKRKYRV